MKTFDDLTIVTSCIGYGKYLTDWANSIANQTVKPGRVCIFTHGTLKDKKAGEVALQILQHRQINVMHEHDGSTLSLPVARNRAVALSTSEWVMHFDADDILNHDAVAEFQRVAPDADVVQAGYERIGQIAGMTTKKRLYTGADGLAVLDLHAMASGNSMFRRHLWEQTPYRLDMLGAWDTALWVGFARLGARFRPSKTAIFKYRQHADSVFNSRRLTMGWSRVHTTAMMRSIRRDYRGVAVIVPRDLRPSPERQRNWERVRRHYEVNHPQWQIIEGFCSSVIWVKGAAIQNALDRCNTDVLVIADADVMVDPSSLEYAVSRVANGIPWAMPHRNVRRANEYATQQICQSSEFKLPNESVLARPVHEGAPGGGIVVVRHVMYDAIGGIPHAFRGWGSEDRALAVLCDTLIGSCQRGSSDLVHLYHPPQEQNVQSGTNLQLLRSLGHAAQLGKDALVQTAHALPRPSAGTQVVPINKFQQRMAQRRLK